MDTTIIYRCGKCENDWEDKDEADKCCMYEAENLSENYKDMRKKSQDKKSSFRESSANMLSDHNIAFETKNGGVHLIVEGSSGYIDFWPSTGRWKTRSGLSGFGVKKLMLKITTGII